jgi:hypothetical protein
MVRDARGRRTVRKEARVSWLMNGVAAIPTLHKIEALFALTK